MDRHSRIGLTPVMLLVVLGMEAAGLGGVVQAQVVFPPPVMVVPGPPMPVARPVVMGPMVDREVVLVQGPPVYVQRAPVVVMGPRYDAFQDALGRLRSRHANSRRDGAVTLGKIGDPRAVPDLVWLLQNDLFGEVRTAAAFALGAIGDARAANALRNAAMTDRNKKVRQAANHAYGKMMFSAPAVAPVAPVTVPVGAVAPAAVITSEELSPAESSRPIPPAPPYSMEPTPPLTAPAP